MNLNDPKFTMNMKNTLNPEKYGTFCFFNEFQISPILFKPMNRAEVIVEAASRKPK